MNSFSLVSSFNQTRLKNNFLRVQKKAENSFATKKNPNCLLHECHGKKERRKRSKRLHVRIQYLSPALWDYWSSIDSYIFSDPFLWFFSLPLFCSLALCNILTHQIQHENEGCPSLKAIIYCFPVVIMLRLWVFGIFSFPCWTFLILLGLSRRMYVELNESNWTRDEKKIKK